MKENQASFTAMSVAYMRAYHFMHGTPKIFDDFLAYDLIPEEKRARIEQHLIEQNVTFGKQLNDSEYVLSPSDQTINSESLMQETHRYAGIFSSRARYAEDALEKAVKQGVKQYVILGA